MKRVQLTHLLAGFIFISTSFVYFATAATHPQNIADSQELTTAAYTHGVAHPPGYPLYSLLLTLFMHLLPLNPAHSASVLSALLQSTAVVLFFFCSTALLEKTGKNLSKTTQLCISSFAAFILAFSYFYWDQATYAEVFGLHMVFVGLILFFILTAPKKSRYLLIYTLFGVAAAHHQTILFLLPGFLYYHAKQVSKPPWVRSVVMFLVGYSVPYFLLFFADSSAPLSWQFEPTAEGFWELISRSVYDSRGSAIETYTREFDLIHSLASVITLGKQVIYHLGLPTVLLALGGLFLLYRRQRVWFWFFAICLIVSGPLLAFYLKFPDPRQTTEAIFFHGTYLRMRMFLLFEYVLCLLIPVAVAYLPHRNILWLIAGILPLYLLLHNYPAVNKHNDTFDQQFYTTVLNDLPTDSILIVDSDFVFGLLYHQTIDAIRPDILIVPTALHMRWGYLQNYLPKEVFEITGYYRLILTLVEWGLLAEQRRVFVMNPSDQFIRQMHDYRYVLTPQGYSAQITSEPNTPTAYDYNLVEDFSNRRFDERDYWNRGKVAALKDLLK